MEKQKISVRVGGKNYTLVSADPPEYIRRVAELTDRRLMETEMASGVSPQQASVLACLNLMDELLRAKDENTELRRRMQRMLAERKSGGAEKTPSPAEA